ncbi:hypothetical protein SAMN05216388_102260 [Halorientalis persicus]|jgi:hypothetical protein|uniref:DUF7313 domain-containing protein n=1 Tax=Halorientalis persicus TaxID=1367881 RepID=A0A1H8TI43_9EURY|nr:hypothetical protein [Halorientalis persicus]SEO90178.1 hypothetical protein SAMN05216388_102260 [Halorientalis persicus]
MQPSVTLFGPLDAILGGQMEYVLLALAVINIGTRAFTYRQHVKQAEEDGADAISRNPIHAASNVVFVLAAFYYTTLHQHSGIVASVLVVGVFIADFFEFEARKVEARRGIDIERPKGAIGASLLALAYIAYLSLFFLVEGLVGRII